MEIAYSGDAFHTYMVISSEEWGENEDEEKMMSNQSAQVLLPFQVQRLNDRKNYCYDISGRMEFRSYIERKQADRSMIKSVIRFIAGLDQAVEEYLLMPDGLLLQPECMYLETEKVFYWLTNYIKAFNRRTFCRDGLRNF